MENLKKLLDFLSPLPFWLRVVIAALVTVIVSVCILLTACTMASSCGITQSVVNNIGSDGNSIEMGVTPSTTTSTTVSPEIPVNVPLKNSLFAVFVFLTFSRSGSGVKQFGEMRRLCVDAADENTARANISDFLSALRYTSPNYLESFDIVNIVSLPPIFYWD